MGMIPPSNEAMERGSSLHRMVESHLTRTEVQARNEEELDFFHSKVVPKISRLDPNLVQEVEQTMTHPLTEQVHAKGIMDLIYDGRIFDWKFTQKPWDSRKFAAYTENQALLYLWLFWKNRSNPPKDLTYWIFPVQGEWQEFQVQFNMKEIVEQLQVYRDCCDELIRCNQQMHFPANPSQFNCRWCQFNDLCPVSVAPLTQIQLPGKRKFGK